MCDYRTFDVVTTPLAPLDFLPTDAAMRIAVIIVTLLLGETFQRSRRNGFERLMQSGLIALRGSIVVFCEERASSWKDPNTHDL